MFASDDMIYMMRRVRIVFVQKTVFTSMLCTGCNELPNLVRDFTGQVTCVDGLVLWLG